ncbi:GATA-type zinc finger protein 1 [Hemibagrus wyckioides]|uniref:GATA-type zinc finger protein 1 n=1 Tax=Hemibagrus wyckioides TaxID=337641 RepID=UPI00266CFDDE|nr:GATA-type zinc finger protein 1 [Hemibagrus wyckioides]
MSSEVNTPADLRTSPNTSENAREDMAPEDLCMTQSSILYLLQEATKLVAPPKQHSLDMAKFHDGTKETIVSHDSTRFEQNVQEVGSAKTQPSFTGAFSMLSCSPWEVMSLINLQCERLLHSDGTHEAEEDSQTHKTKMDTESEDGDVVQEFPSAVSTSPESSGTDTMEHVMESDVSCSVPHIDPTDHLSIRSTGENGEGAAVEAVEDLAELISKTTEDSLLSSRVMSDKRTDHCSLVETSVLPLDLTKKVGICEHPIGNSQGVNKMGNVSSICDAAQSPEISSVDFTSSLVAEKYQGPCFSFNEGENAECECALMSETPPPRTDLNNNLEDEPLQEAEKTCTVVSTQARWGNQRRTPRKQAHPARSPDLNDPELQGVTFSMRTQLDHSTDQCRLLITSNYSKLCRRGRRSRSCRSRSLQSSQRTSSSEEESDSSSMCKKICASCCTRKTPLWRDAEDGTPLCNACGIRYKKYRVRCLQCWNIPRKEASSNSKCLKCGDLLQLSSQSKRAGC